MLTYIKKQRIQMALNIQLIRLSKKYNTSLPKLVLDKKEGSYIGHYDYETHTILLDPNKLHGYRDYMIALRHEFRHHWQWTHHHKDYMWWIEHYDIYESLYPYSIIEIDARLFSSNEELDNDEIFEIFPTEKVEQAYQQGFLMEACKYLADVAELDL